MQREAARVAIDLVKKGGVRAERTAALEAETWDAVSKRRFSSLFLELRHLRPCSGRIHPAYRETGASPW